jgi:hypothetical protein
VVHHAAESAQLEPQNAKRYADMLRKWKFDEKEMEACAPLMLKTGFADDVHSKLRLHDITATVIVPKLLPTNSTVRNHPVHRWFNFVASFSLEFVGA